MNPKTPKSKNSLKTEKCLDSSGFNADKRIREFNDGWKAGRQDIKQKLLAELDRRIKVQQELKGVGIKENLAIIGFIILELNSLHQTIEEIFK